MALYKSGTTVELREVDLKEKPEALVDIAPDAAVPVLVQTGNQVMSESLEIMLWALKKNDPGQWLVGDRKIMEELIERNDDKFADVVHRYRRPQDFPKDDRDWARDAGFEMLRDLEEKLAAQRYLLGDKVTLADIAVFPFVRQFAYVDRPWFDSLDLSRLQQWLGVLDESPVFKAVMGKFHPWSPGDTPLYLASMSAR